MTAPTAVVSGLGPNGILAATGLFRAGWDVTAVEQRPRYARPIHVSLRQSYLDDVAAVDPALRVALDPHLSPISQHDHFVFRDDMVRPAPPPDRSPTDHPVAARLAVAPAFHARIDELETAGFRHLIDLSRSRTTDGARMRLVRGHRVECHLEPDQRFRTLLGPSPHTGPDQATAPPQLPLAPDLVVVAEGGKSVTAKSLRVPAMRFSDEKQYISVHVDVPLGPITRRIDTDLRSARLLVESEHDNASISLWAVGHAVAQKGTWVVMEIPADLSAFAGKEGFELDYFLTGAMHLFGLSAPGARRFGLDDVQQHWVRLREGRTPGFSGTFAFAQQMLATPAWGNNMVFFGDCAGMGHHALASGLELGAIDWSALGALARRRAQDPGAPLDPYADAVTDSRVALLCEGLPEYGGIQPFAAAEPMAQAVQMARQHIGKAREFWLSVQTAADRQNLRQRVG